MAFLNKIFSIKKDGYTKHITIFGLKIKHTNRIKKLEEENQKLLYKIYKYCPNDKRDEALKDWYYECTGEILDLENPKTFNEKIQWLKLYDSTPIKTRLADKYLVREWVKEKIGEEYLIPLLGVWDKAEDIDFDKLPKQFVLKCNHGSGYNIIVKDKSKINVNKIRKQLNEWLNEDYAFKSGFELHYSDIPRKIIAEEYINPIESSIELQCYCFNGNVEFISFENTKDTKKPCRCFFSNNWENVNVMVNPKHYKPFKQIPKKPQYLKKLIDSATILSKNFSFVRIDYIYYNNLLFREMTFTSGSGLTSFQPKSFTNILGDLIHLSQTLAGADRE